MPVGVLMGVDWGGRRIGLALSDPGRLLARPLEILVRSGEDLLPDSHDEKVLTRLEFLVRQNGVVALVFGVPYYHLSGDPNPRAPLFLEAGRQVGERLSLPVFFYDEGQTSSRARELRPAKKKQRGRKDPCDDLAAVLLLQGFLDDPAPAQAEKVATSGGGDDRETVSPESRRPHP